MTEQEMACHFPGRGFRPDYPAPDLLAAFVAELKRGGMWTKAHGHVLRGVKGSHEQRSGEPPEALHVTS